MSVMNASPWFRRAQLLLAGGVFVALAASAVLAQAHPGPMDGHGPHGLAAGVGPMAGMGAPMGAMMGGRRAERMLEAAGVSAEQRAQIRQLVEAAHAEGAKTRDDGRALHDRMRQLFTQPTVDANAVEALRQQQLARMDAASKRRMQLMLDVSRVLTPEQRTRLAEQMQKRMDRMRGRHDHAGHGPQK
jgi:Spy/CpxP family protein refolding chaperone